MRSYEKGREISDLETDNEACDLLELWSARFVRACDILIHKIYHTIDSVELTDGGSMLDVIHRAQKRALIVSVDEIREMKDLRNQIAHEYITRDGYLSLL